MKKNLLTIAALLALVYSPLLVAGEKCDPKSCAKDGSKIAAKCDPKECPPSPECKKVCPEGESKAAKGAAKGATAKPAKA